MPLTPDEMREMERLRNEPSPPDDRRERFRQPADGIRIILPGPELDPSQPDGLKRHPEDPPP